MHVIHCPKFYMASAAASTYVCARLDCLTTGVAIPNTKCLFGLHPVSGCLKLPCHAAQDKSVMSDSSRQMKLACHEAEDTPATSSYELTH